MKTKRKSHNKSRMKRRGTKRRTYKRGVTKRRTYKRGVTKRRTYKRRTLKRKNINSSRRFRGGGDDLINFDAPPVPLFTPRTNAGMSPAPPRHYQVFSQDPAPARGRTIRGRVPRPPQGVRHDQMSKGKSRTGMFKQAVEEDAESSRKHGHDPSKIIRLSSSPTQVEEKIIPTPVVSDVGPLMNKTRCKDRENRNTSIAGLVHERDRLIADLDVTGLNDNKRTKLNNKLNTTIQLLRALEPDNAQHNLGNEEYCNKDDNCYWGPGVGRWRKGTGCHKKGTRAGDHSRWNAATGRGSDR
jgi:hypothetical protein